MDKLDLIIQKLDKLDKIETDINSMKNDNKDIHKKLDILVDTVADMKEDITAIR